MKLSYFNLTDIEYQSYISIPKALILNIEFKNVSAEAKILYSLMLDRMKLSLINNYADNLGRVYIVYPLDEIMDNLNISISTASKRIKELVDLGFIEKKQQGLNKPNLIYVKKIEFDRVVNQYLVSKNEKRRDNDSKRIF